MKTKILFSLFLVFMCAYVLNAQTVIGTLPPGGSVLNPISPVKVGSTGNVTICSPSATTILTGIDLIATTGISISTTLDANYATAALTGWANKQSF